MDKLFPASIERLYEMLEYISTYANEAGFKQDTVKNIELGVEEALVNVIIHGYKQQANGNILISLKSTMIPGIEITITDNGVPFNPDTYANSTSPLVKCMDNDNEVGGWGLFLIFKLMDKVEYTRIEGKNVLKLEKHLEGA